MLEKISDAIKKLFVKEERVPCMVWDGKIIKYLDLTQSEIDKMQEEFSNNKDFKITKKSEL